MSGIVREVLFNDGEGLDFGDLNNAQRFARAFACDVLQGQNLRTYDPECVGLTSALYAIGMGGTAWPTLAARTVSNREGTILQYLSTTDGSDATILAYYLTGGELLTQLDAGDATNPRYDIISVKLDQVEGTSTTRDFEDATTRAKTSSATNKRRDVVLTKLVTKGTPAGSPSVPATPAGYVRWALLYVPATFNAAFVTTGEDGSGGPRGLHDDRYPVPRGGTAAIVGYQMLAASGWTAQANGSMASAAANNVAYAIFPGSRCARISRVMVCGTLAGASSAIDLVRFDLRDGTVAVLERLGTTLSGSEQKLYTPARPRWGSGFACPSIDDEGNAGVSGVSDATAIGVKITAGSNADVIRCVRFFYAG